MKVLLLEKLQKFMRLILGIFIASLLTILNSSCKDKSKNNNDNEKESNQIITTYWSGMLLLQEEVKLPFLLSTIESKTDSIIEIYNDDEVISLKKTQHDDSLKYNFEAFNTYLILKRTKNKMQGYFVQPDRSSHKRIPFSASIKNETKPEVITPTNHSVDGKWKVIFNTNEENAYPSIGVFDQHQKGRVTGTFMTETGDYRYLDGFLNKDSLTLSTFDGAHAFLFTAHLNQNSDSLEGMFYSGRHWNTHWVGSKNDTFKLSNPNDLTYLVKDTFQFKFPTVNNTVYSFPNKELQGKVKIIQIFGTWCPNCMDETRYFNDLHEKYNKKGLEIIGVAYEYPSKFKAQAQRIKRFKDNLNVPYTILVGGKASKEKAASDFSMLNDITSFPTSIFINKKGEIVKIHTGFNGPGTGEVYEDYVKKTNALIKKLINE